MAGAYVSADGGKTWEPTLEKKSEQGGMWYGDPAVAFGPDGAAYFAMMFSAGLGREITSSGDGGRSWSCALIAKHLVDRPFLVADCTRGRFRGRLYCMELTATTPGCRASASQNSSAGATRRRHQRRVPAAGWVTRRAWRPTRQGQSGACLVFPCPCPWVSVFALFRAFPCCWVAGYFHAQAAPWDFIS